MTKGVVHANVDAGHAAAFQTLALVFFTTQGGIRQSVPAIFGQYSDRGQCRMAPDRFVPHSFPAQGGVYPQYWSNAMSVLFIPFPLYGVAGRVLSAASF